MSDVDCSDSICATSEYSENLTPFDHDIFLLAKTYFDLREFPRVVALLETAEHPKLLFLRYYSAFLVIDKQISDASSKNKQKLRLQINSLSQEVKSAVDSHSNDGFLSFLYINLLSCY